MGQPLSFLESLPVSTCCHDTGLDQAEGIVGALFSGWITVTHEIVSVLCGANGLPEVMSPTHWYDNRENKLTPCQAYQFLLESSKSEVIIYIHDDVTIRESGWLTNIMDMFNHMNATVVGLGGAASLGNPSLYKHPYRISDLARGGYVSNQTDWGTHGGHEIGIKRVAVVDAFFMAVRRDFLLSVGGWPVQLTHHCLDLWLACEAARHNKETWMVGVSCTHHGGGTSTKPTYREAKWLQGGTLESDHQLPHRWLYEEYRDVLPIMVG